MVEQSTHNRLVVGSFPTRATNINWGYMNYLKHKLHLILFSILVLSVLGIITNSIAEGIDRIISQEMVDNTYKINR